MNPEDFKRFGVFMLGLQETFSPDKPISKQRAKIYFEILKDIPIENIELGIEELMKKKKQRKSKKLYNRILTMPFL